MTLSDFERWDVRGQIFQADRLNNARPRMTKFGRITRVEQKSISVGQTWPYLKGWDPMRSPILRGSLLFLRTCGGLVSRESTTTQSQRGGALALPNFSVSLL